MKGVQTWDAAMMPAKIAPAVLLVYQMENLPD